MAKIMTTGTMQVELTVDDDLLEKISKHKWNVFKTGHVQSKIKGRIVRLQRFVMGAEDVDGVKRVSGDKYDFRCECVRRQSCWYRLSQK